MKTAEQCIEELRGKDFLEMIKGHGLIAAMENYAGQFKPKWVSVEDRLPEIGQYVLIATRDNKVISEQCIADGTLSSPWYFHSTYRVTHWMELPEGPDNA